MRDWNDLRHYGINFLTGEACAVGKRLLCDVNEQGRRLLCSIFGLPINTAFSENWNSQINGDEAIGSIFLPHQSFGFLSAMILLQTGCQCGVVLENGTVLGIEPDDDVSGKCTMPVEEEIDDPDRPGEKKWVAVEKEVNDPLGRIRRFHNIREVYGTMNVPRRGLCAVHAMSGRSQSDE
jgi:hypothetical protein